MPAKERAFPFMGPGHARYPRTRVGRFCPRAAVPLLWGQPRHTLPADLAIATGANRGTALFLFLPSSLKENRNGNVGNPHHYWLVLIIYLFLINKEVPANPRRSLPWPQPQILPPANRGEVSNVHFRHNVDFKGFFVLDVPIICSGGNTSPPPRVAQNADIAFPSTLLRPKLQPQKSVLDGRHPTTECPSLIHLHHHAPLT